MTDPTNVGPPRGHSIMMSRTGYPKLLENSKLALVCCFDEWRGWVSSNRPNSESCTATSPYHPLELTGNFLVTVAD